ncbi:MAG TPA: ATP-binding cassette domain-containing protein [Acidimicrobiia bacterium]|nr:ATP-binding cassette domain-containing protein [Acidimicrobiia bacterium]
MTEFALAAERVVKSFGEGETLVQAVRDVDLGVAPGEVVLIMGPSGSGKTTLLSMLGAMLKPTSGRIIAAGSDLTALPESKLPRFRAATFGFVFQDFNLLAALNARENVELALNLAGVTGMAARSRAVELLEGFGLSDRLDFKPHKLSGGEKQRVAIARALANRPPVILADEPTANLDSKIGHEIAGLLRSAATDEKRAVVMVSHDNRLKEVADRILWLEDGAFRALEEMGTDPICGMSVDRRDSPHFQAGDTTYYFCSTGCRDEFAARKTSSVVDGRHRKTEDVLT